MERGQAWATGKGSSDYDGARERHKAEFDALFKSLVDDLKPEGVLEEMLVEKIAVCHWRSRRAMRAENGEIMGTLDTLRLEWSKQQDEAVREQTEELDFGGIWMRVQAVREQRRDRVYVRGDRAAAGGVAALDTGAAFAKEKAIRARLKMVKVQEETQLRAEAAKAVLPGKKSMERLQGKRGGEFVPPTLNVELSDGRVRPGSLERGKSGNRQEYGSNAGRNLRSEI